MPLRSIIIRSMAATSLLVLSSLVQAGSTNATVTVGPLAATSVPTLSGSLLIMLGLLLAVIAFRTLRNNQGAQKLLGILVLGGGLIVSGMGVDQTLAISPTSTVSASGAVCNTSGPLNYNAVPSANTILKNDCTNSIEIKGFSASCTLETNASCKQGQVLTAGATCSFLPKCTSAPG